MWKNRFSYNVIATSILPNKAVAPRTQKICAEGRNHNLHRTFIQFCFLHCWWVLCWVWFRKMKAVWLEDQSTAGPQRRSTLENMKESTLLSLWLGWTFACWGLRMPCAGACERPVPGTASGSTPWALHKALEREDTHQKDLCPVPIVCLPHRQQQAWKCY